MALLFEELPRIVSLHSALRNIINFIYQILTITHFKRVVGNCFDGPVIIKFADTGPYNTWNTKNIVGKTIFCKSSLNLKLVTPSIRANRQKWHKDPGDEKLCVKVGISCFTKNIIHLILRYCFKMQVGVCSMISCIFFCRDGTPRREIVVCPAKEDESLKTSWQR